MDVQISVDFHKCFGDRTHTRSTQIHTNVPCPPQVDSHIHLNCAALQEGHERPGGGEIDLRCQARVTEVTLCLNDADGMTEPFYMVRAVAWKLIYEDEDGD